MATLQPGEKARMYALGGIMRGGASRGGYVDSRVYINIDGEDIGWGSEGLDDPAHVGVLLGTLTISDILDETPNTCSFRVNGYVPADGAEVRITRGSTNTLTPLFAGYALTVQQLYAGIPKNVQADVRAVDYTWLLAMQKVTRQYRNLSATAIITDLVATFAAVNGFTTVHVTAGLPVLDVITFTDEDLPDAITRTCRRIGAYWYVDYRKDVHVFFEDTSQTPPVPLTAGHPSLTNFSRLHERTQGLTRVYVEGRGSSVLAAVNAGETEILMESADMFTAAADTFLKVSVQGADSALHLNFAGVVPSTGGSLVGPGASPTAPVTLTSQAGAGVTAGAHDYAVTFTTAAGESLPSTRATISSGPVADPTVAPYNVMVVPNQTFNGSRFTIGDTLCFSYQYGTQASYPFTSNVTRAAPQTGWVTMVSNQDPYNPSHSAPVHMQIPNSPDSSVTQILIYAYAQSRGFYMYVGNVTNQPTSPYPANWDTRGNGYSSQDPYFPPAANSTGRNQVVVSDIPVGVAAVTGRKLYRTAANQAQLKLLTTLANNTATTYTDTAADAALGANAPAGDTSGLQSPAGVVHAGDTSLIVASTGPFHAAGGWALAGEQAIRYRGLEVGRLVGIPPTGRGAIVGPIQYNTSIRSAPMLTGIPASGTRSLPIPLSAGDEVYAVVQVDDTARQAQLAADLNVTLGIREEWVSDRRLSIPEARARGQATLQSRPLVDATIEYTCRDTRTASGQTIEVNIGPPTSVVGYFKIQQVTWSNFRPRPEQPPTARVTASSRRFSFEDLLRIVKTKE